MVVLLTELGALNASFLERICRDAISGVIPGYSADIFNDLLRNGREVKPAIIKVFTDDYELEARIFNCDLSPTGDADIEDHNPQDAIAASANAKDPLVYFDKIVLRVRDFGKKDPKDLESWINQVKAAMKDNFAAHTPVQNRLPEERRENYTYVYRYKEKGESISSVIKISKKTGVIEYYCHKEGRAEPMVLSLKKSKLNDILAKLTGVLGKLYDNVEQQPAPVQNEWYASSITPSLKNLECLLGNIVPTKGRTFKVHDMPHDSPYVVELEIRCRGYTRVTNNGKLVDIVPVYDVRRISVTDNTSTSNSFGYLPDNYNDKKQEQIVKAFSEYLIDAAKAENQGISIEQLQEDGCRMRRYTLANYLDIVPCIASIGRRLEITFRRGIRTEIQGNLIRKDVQGNLLLTQPQLLLLAYNMMYALDSTSRNRHQLTVAQAAQ